MSTTFGGDDIDDDEVKSILTTSRLDLDVEMNQDSDIQEVSKAKVNHIPSSQKSEALLTSFGGTPRLLNL